MSASKPNVLIITADQHRGDALGVEGRPVKTPHLDRIAQRGTRFSTCITPNPVCQPARASILTGLLPRSHGVPDNGIDLDPKTGEAGFARQFANAGYKTGLIGKAHFSTYNTFSPTGNPECNESSANYPDDWYGPYMGFDHVELAVEPHNTSPPARPPHGQHYERWLYSQADPDEIESLTAFPPELDAAQTWHAQLPPAWHNSSWCGDRTVEFLRQNGDEPFCLWTSFPDPHHPFDCPEPWSRLHSPDEVDLPEYRKRDLDRRPWWHRAALENTPQLADRRLLEYRSAFSRVPDQSDEQMVKLLANYYGMVSLIDHNVGRIMATLRELGLEDDTIVIYTSDHGDWMGDHGLILKGPMPYDGLLRVPFLMQGPGVEAGRVVNAPISTMDIAATVHDYCAVPAAVEMHSRSLRGLLDGSETTRDYAYNEWDLHPSRCGVALQLRTIRTEAHRLTVDAISGAGELYDLDRDRHELQNVYDDPDYAEVRAAMEAMIEERPDDVIVDPPEPVGMA